jgi:hypothetical protein
MEFEEDEQKRRFAGLKLPREDRLRAAVVRAEKPKRKKAAIRQDCSPSNLMVPKGRFCLQYFKQ